MFTTTRKPLMQVNARSHADKDSSHTPISRKKKPAYYIF